jgi:broad specificity phosphatase PhoE
MTVRYRVGVIPALAVLVLAACAGLTDRQPLAQPGPDAMHAPGRPVTALFIVRHAEPDYTQACDPADCAPAPGTDCPRNPCLSTAGKARARELRHALQKARIQAIFSTDLHRTRETAQPLSAFTQLPVEIYNSNADLITKIMTGHRGQRILVVSHSMMVEDLITRLNGSAADCKIDGEFDNLCFVLHSAYETGVIHLQYGTWTDY